MRWILMSFLFMVGTFAIPCALGGVLNVLFQGIMLDMSKCAELNFTSLVWLSILNEKFRGCGSF